MKNEVQYPMTSQSDLALKEKIGVYDVRTSNQFRLCENIWYSYYTDNVSYNRYSQTVHIRFSLFEDVPKGNVCLCDTVINEYKVGTPEFDKLIRIIKKDNLLPCGLAELRVKDFVSEGKCKVLLGDNYPIIDLDNMEKTLSIF